MYNQEIFWPTKEYQPEWKQPISSSFLLLYLKALTYDFVFPFKINFLQLWTLNLQTIISYVNNFRSLHLFSSNPRFPSLKLQPPLLYSLAYQFPLCLQSRTIPLKNHLKGIVLWISLFVLQCHQIKTKYKGTLWFPFLYHHLPKYRSV